MSPLSPLLELMSWHLMLALLVRHVPGGCQTKPGHTLSLPSLISQHIQTIFPNLPFPVLFFPSKSDLYWALVGLPTVPTSFSIFLHAGIWPHYACFPKRSTLEPPIWGPRWTQAPLVSSSIQSRSIFHQIRREEGFTNSGKEKKNMPAAFKWIFFSLSCSHGMSTMIRIHFWWELKPREELLHLYSQRKSAYQTRV